MGAPEKAPPLPGDRFVSLTHLRTPEMIYSMLRKGRCRLLVLDQAMGWECFKQVIHDFPEVKVIILGDGTGEKWLQAGAFAWEPRERCKEELLYVIHRAIEWLELDRENRTLSSHFFSKRVYKPEAFEGVVTENEKMLSIFQYCEVIAPGDGPLFISGEAGVGKNLLGRVIHKLGGLKGRCHFLKAEGEAGFEEILMGNNSSRGFWDSARGGTLILNDPGAMTPRVQERLLNYFQKEQREVRLIFTAREDLAELVEAGSFRKDLWYLITSHHIKIPPLRERMEDLPALVSYFLEKATRELGQNVPPIPERLMPLLGSYYFPGNIRELESMMYSALKKRKGPLLPLGPFKKAVEGRSYSGDGMPFIIPGVIPSLKEAEDILIREALKRAGNNQSIAARYLGISRQALNKRLKKQKNSSEL